MNKIKKKLIDIAYNLLIDYILFEKSEDVWERLVNLGLISSTELVDELTFNHFTVEQELDGFTFSKLENLVDYLARVKFND